MFTILCLMLKARNFKYDSMNGLKEHMICYISSGRSSIVSDLMSQLGGKSRRLIIDRIIRNSEVTCKFNEPNGVSIFVSFNNIEKLIKSYRLTSKEQEKVYAVPPPPSSPHYPMATIVTTYSSKLRIPPVPGTQPTITMKKMVFSVRNWIRRLC